MRMPRPSRIQTRRPCDEPTRDAGVTLVEIIVTVVMFALVTGVIASAVVVVFRSEQGVVASTSEAQDTRQIVNFLPLDVGSGSRNATGYRAVVGGAGGDRGTGCSEPGNENLLRIDVSATERIAYHLDLPDPGAVTTSARIDRYVCVLTDGGWAADETVNIADSLDVPVDGGDPLHIAEVVVTNPTAELPYQRVETVRLDYVQRGREESFSAVPRTENPYQASGLCDGQPLEAAASIASFVIGDVTLEGTAVMSALYVGGALTFKGSVSVAQAVPNDADPARVPAKTGLLAGSVNWYDSTGSLDVLNGYSVEIAGQPGADYVVQGGSPGGGGPGNGGGNGGGGPGNGGGNTATSIVGPAHVEGVGGKVTLQGSGGDVRGSGQLSLDPAESFLDLTYCSERLAELPNSCDGDCAAHVGLPGGYPGTGTAGSNDTTLSLTPGVANVLNLDESNLLDLQDDTIFLPANLVSDSTPLIINVATDQGGSVVFTPPAVQGLGQSTVHVIWNFPNAANVTILNATPAVGLAGTLVAPYATVTSYADIKGGVIARNFIMYGGQLSDQNAFLVDAGIFWG